MMIKVPELHLATPQQREGSYYYGVSIYSQYYGVLKGVVHQLNSRIIVNETLEEKIDKLLRPWLLSARLPLISLTIHL